MAVFDPQLVADQLAALLAEAEQFADENIALISQCRALQTKSQTLLTKSHQVVKQRVGKRLLRITRRVAYGCLEQAEELMQASQVLLGVINTAYIERLNATLRTWMPALVRRTRTPSGSRERLEAALFWTGCVYNFCHVHATLAGTPAMAGI